MRGCDETTLLSKKGRHLFSSLSFPILPCEVTYYVVHVYIHIHMHAYTRIHTGQNRTMDDGRRKTTVEHRNQRIEEGSIHLTIRILLRCQPHRETKERCKTNQFSSPPFRQPKPAKPLAFLARLLIQKRSPCCLHNQYRNKYKRKERSE